MLTSLFGDLNALVSGPPAERWEDTQVHGHLLADGASFAATAILESTDTSVNARGQMVDRHVRELVCNGSPARAMREHFAATRADVEVATRVLTLYDPIGLWAPAVIKALSDASGHPVERLHLRDQATLRTLATIERTEVVRRLDDTLKIYHAQAQSDEPEHREIPQVLMERAHLAAVIVGPMAGPGVEALIDGLLESTARPTWRCPALLFLLPPTASDLAARLQSVAWPTGLQVQCIVEPLRSTSAVWNTLLGAWNRVRELPAWSLPGGGAALLGGGFPIRVADLGPSAAAWPATAEPAAQGQTASAWAAGAGTSAVPAAQATTAAAPAAPAPGTRRLDTAKATRALRELLDGEGVIACAVVDEVAGTALCRAQRPPVTGELQIDLDAAATACAAVLRAHRDAARATGLREPLDEVLVGAGQHQQALRCLRSHAGQVLWALLDRQHTNLARVRQRMLEIDRSLA